MGFRGDVRDLENTEPLYLFKTNKVSALEDTLLSNVSNEY